LPFNILNHVPARFYSRFSLLCMRLSFVEPVPQGADPDAIDVGWLPADRSVLLVVVGLEPGELENVDKIISTYIVSFESFSTVICSVFFLPGLMVIVFISSGDPGDVGCGTWPGVVVPPPAVGDVPFPPSVRVLVTIDTSPAAPVVGNSITVMLPATPVVTTVIVVVILVGLVDDMDVVGKPASVHMLVAALSRAKFFA
jgi:hypothetical protein